MTVVHLVTPFRRAPAALPAAPLLLFIAAPLLPPVLGRNFLGLVPQKRAKNKNCEPLPLSKWRWKLRQGVWSGARDTFFQFSSPINYNKRNTFSTISATLRLGLSWCYVDLLLVFELYFDYNRQIPRTNTVPRATVIRTRILNQLVSIQTAISISFPNTYFYQTCSESENSI